LIGGETIYGKKMQQEAFDTKFSKIGLVGMVNTGKYKNGSAFFISLSDHSHLDNKVVVVGEVTEGLENVLKLSENFGKSAIKITSAGEIESHEDDHDHHDDHHH
jgi:cyclophilin family peptidyl-prolyl cis-trans isomerase